MIKGLTHDTDTGVLNRITKYKGKISTGYAPQEGPNKNNYPAPAGFFRILKEITRTVRVDGKNESQKVWKLNEDAQKKLESSIESTTPRKLDFMCLFKTPNELWESSLAMYSSSEGLVCKSHGEGTAAKCLQFDEEGNRIWKEREFSGKKGCVYKECPDFKSCKCKPIGLMKIFPVVDLSTQPYRFETRSINTIIGVESSLNEMWNLSRAAYAALRAEMGNEAPAFEGLFGVQMSLIHKKIKSGGREVHITEVIPSAEFSASVMAPIQRAIANNQKAALEAGSKGVALLDTTEALSIEAPTVNMDQDDEKAIATDFNADADKDKKKNENDNTLNSASKTLLDK